MIKITMVNLITKTLVYLMRANFTALFYFLKKRSKICITFIRIFFSTHVKRVQYDKPFYLSRSFANSVNAV